MDSLIRRFHSRSDVRLKVLLLENGLHDAASRSKLREAVHGASVRGLDVEVRTLGRQKSDAEAGVFAATLKQISGRKSIALSRTMLQHYLFLVSKPRLGSVVWILDDDVVLDGLVYGPDGGIQACELDYVSAIKSLRGTGNCVVLGEVTGDPPLPFLSSIRTQLVDLYHNLHQLAAFPPNAPYPDRSDENRLQRLSRRDYYYDLSRYETSHLETPFWYEPSDRRMVAGQVLREMVSRLPEVLAGRQVFRPLVHTEASGSAPGLVPSINRGPSTLVFDLQALREFPNTVPEADGVDMRRSDMVWSLLNRYVGGCRMVSAPLPVRQNREPTGGGQLDFGTLSLDISGYAFYSSMHDVLLQKAQHRQRQGKEPFGRVLLQFNGGDISRATELYAKYVRERLRAFELSFLRVVGIVSALRVFYDPNAQDEACRPWWLGSGEYRETTSSLKTFVESLKDIYTEDNLVSLKQSLSGLNDTPVIARYLASLPETVARHRSQTPLPKEELSNAASEYVQEEFGTGALTCLGVGEEGVVLTDRQNVYKYFHYWKTRDRDLKVDFLQSLTGRLSGYPTLPDVQEVRRCGEHVVAVYPYEEGNRYKGGYLDGILNLLRECRDAGISLPQHTPRQPGGYALRDKTGRLRL